VLRAAVQKHLQIDADTSVYILGAARVRLQRRASIRLLA
jgi:hypothetical protein